MKGVIRICSCYRDVKLIGHEMKVVDRVLEKRLCRIVTINELQFVFLPEEGITDAVFILRILQEEYCASGMKLHLCFVDLEKAFDGVKMTVLIDNVEERYSRIVG